MSVINFSSVLAIFDRLTKSFGFCGSQWQNWWCNLINFFFISSVDEQIEQVDLVFVHFQSFQFQVYFYLVVYNNDQSLWTRMNVFWPKRSILSFLKSRTAWALFISFLFSNNAISLQMTSVWIFTLLLPNSVSLTTSVNQHSHHCKIWICWSRQFFNQRYFIFS